MRYRLVILDFDGTLADSFPWFLASIGPVAERHGLRRPGREETEALRGLPSREVLRALAVPAWKLPRVIREMRALKAAAAAEIPLFPGIPEALAGLAAAGLRLAIVSSDSEASIRTGLGPTGALIGHYGCGAGLFGKAPLLRQAVRAAGLAPADALYIGDESRDAEAAAKAGLDFGAVAWGYARGADSRGVDIIQHCAVTGIRRNGNRVEGVETTQGFIRAKKVGIAVAGHSTVVADMAGLRLPIESHVLQAMVSEPVKPMLDTVVTSGAVHFYISQSDKGELVMGGDIDMYNSYAQRGNQPVLEHVVGAALALFPAISRLRMLRLWGGIMDMSMYGSPIISRTSLDNFYINCGWCYGGFKATPGSGWCFAHTIAQDRPHELNAAFTLDRYTLGNAIDERGAGPTAWLH